MTDSPITLADGAARLDAEKLRTYLTEKYNEEVGQVRNLYKCPICQIITHHNSATNAMLDVGNNGDSAYLGVWTEHDYKPSVSYTPDKLIRYFACEVDRMLLRLDNRPNITGREALLALDLAIARIKEERASNHL